jgi:lysophospholipase L1-like esterase
MSESEFEGELSGFDHETAPRRATVFYGSSSFRLWDGIVQAFPRDTVVNRGFGGSTLAECFYLLPRVIFPLEPARLVLYAADNDLDHGTSPEDVTSVFRQFVERVRDVFPVLPMAFVAVKPSPSRFWNLDAIRRANELIRGVIPQYPGVAYVDVFAEMLNADGGPRPELFTEDGLHMNATGYALWAVQIRSWLDSLPPICDQAPSNLSA